MQNLWNDKFSSKLKSDLDLRVYSSNLLGQEPSLVLHGGGNTSVKINEKNILGNNEEIIYIKGSGWDLVSIKKEGFSPVRLDYVAKLAELSSLSDPQMVNELLTQLKNASAPNPSVETILHAVLPYRYVDHTHADSVVTISNTPNGKNLLQEIYGDKVIIIPYVMPGFDLAKLVNDYYQKYASSKTEGIVLMNHGIFSFGETAKQSYTRMIDLVTLAEDYLKINNSWILDFPKKPKKSFNSIEFAKLRNRLSISSGGALLMHMVDSDKGYYFASLSNITDLAKRGPLTPDHVIRTKRIPMVGRDIENYVAEYTEYFNEFEPAAKERKTMIDPTPRVILDRDFGLCAVGKNMTEVNIISDIYNHTIDAILKAEKLQSWQALPQKDIFALEYWDLEQAKLRKNISKLEFEGEVVVITGAASGIGKSCVEKFLEMGSAVVGIDINKNVLKISQHSNYLGIVADITSEININNAFNEVVKKFGGVDMLVLNAGIFPEGKNISDINLAEWKKVFDINLNANFSILKIAYDYLKLAPKYGRIVIVGSKNVPAPGPGASAYSSSKAALNQLMRVLSMEWGKDKIRINSVHPNAVFDTGIWTEDVINNRARHYNISVEEYKTNNILKEEVLSRDVANLICSMCGENFSKTTSSQIPIDGGNDRVI